MNAQARFIARVARLGVAILLPLVAMLALAGCSSTDSAARADGVVARDFGAQDPCQRTILKVRAKDGVDLEQSGPKLVNAYEGYQAIGEVTLDPKAGVLDVTWCNAMQSEEGVVRAVNLSGLVAIEEFNTAPVN